VWKKNGIDDEGLPRMGSEDGEETPLFGDVDHMFREMEKMMEEELKNFTERVPKDYVKERKLPDGEHS